MEIANIQSNKKWLLGVEGSRSPIEIGHFEIPNDQYHYHEKVYEYYIVYVGELTIVIDGKETVLNTGSICCVEPFEKHEVISGSKDLKCFLLKFPHLPDDKIIVSV